MQEKKEKDVQGITNNDEKEEETQSHEGREWERRDKQTWELLTAAEVRAGVEVAEEYTFQIILGLSWRKLNLCLLLTASHALVRVRFLLFFFLLWIYTFDCVWELG